jgi:hypothetical protein
MDHTQPESNGRLNGSEDFRQFRNSLEAVNNLIFLASREADNAERVRFYLDLAKERLGKVSALLHPSSD